MDIQSYAYADEAHTRIDELDLIVTKSGNVVSLTGDVLATATVGLNGNISLETTIDGEKHTHLIDNIQGLQQALNEKIDVSREGVANGIATLNEIGLVPSEQLPSYVDDVIEYNTRVEFPEQGESGKIYIDINSQTIYRWSGSMYVPVGTENAQTADKLTTPRLIELVGDVTGSVVFDGSGNIQIVTTFPELGQIIEDSKFKYTNESPMPSNVGGLEKGTTFSNATLQRLFTDLLYPYQYPSFTKFFIADQPTILEVGDTLSGGVRTFEFNISNDINVSKNSISIKDNTNNNIFGINLPNNNEVLLDIGADVVKTTSNSHSYSITAQNSRDQSISRTFHVRWRWRMYYGSSQNENLSQDQIKSLQNNELSTTFASTKTYDAQGYKYIVYPISFGVASSFKDANSGFAIAMEEPTQVQISNQYGVSTQYYVYRTTNPIVSSLTITVE